MENTHGGARGRMTKDRKAKISAKVKEAHARKKAEIEELKKQANKTEAQKQQEDKEHVIKMKQEYFDKIEPYLKAGLSVHKSCIEAKIPYATVWNYIQTDDEYLEKVNRARQYLSILTSNVFYNLLIQIGRKISTKDENGKDKKPERLTKDELGLLMWHSTKSKAVREEYGDHSELDVNENKVEKVEEVLGKNIDDVLAKIVNKQKRKSK